MVEVLALDNRYSFTYKDLWFMIVSISSVMSQNLYQNQPIYVFYLYTFVKIASTKSGIFNSPLGN